MKISTESNIINKEWNLRTIVLILMILFFIGGVAVGFAWGGHDVQKNWEEFYNKECRQYIEQKNDKINTEVFEWESKK